LAGALQARLDAAAGIDAALLERALHIPLPEGLAERLLAAGPAPRRAPAHCVLVLRSVTRNA
jgi:hypothetical protein